MLLARSPIVSPSPMLMRRRRSSIPLWLRLVQEAEAAAAAAGASLWYAPPAGYADRSVNGPFVGSDGSGGVPALGSGVVGWLRDRSGGALGSELTTNGNFASAGTGWTPVGTVTFATGSASFIDQATNTSSFFQSLSLSANITYRITIAGTGQINYRIDTVATSGPVTLPATLYVAAASISNPRIQIYNVSGTAAVVTGVSLRSFSGNHATQSTSANRPVLVAAPGAAAAADGFAALSFDGSNDRLVSASFSSVNAETMIAAFIRTASTGTYHLRVAAKLGSVDNLSVGQANDGQLTARVNTVSGQRTAFVPSSLNSPIVQSLIATTVGYEWWSNGSPLGVSALNAQYSPSAGVVNVGANSLNSDFAPNNVALACYAPTAVTTAQREAIERLGAYIVGAPYPGL